MRRRRTGHVRANPNGGPPIVVPDHDYETRGGQTQLADRDVAGAFAETVSNADPFGLGAGPGGGAGGAPAVPPAVELQWDDNRTDAQVKQDVNAEMSARMQQRLRDDRKLRAYMHRTWPDVDPDDAAVATTRMVIDSWANSPNQTPVGRELQQAVSRTFGTNARLTPRTEAGWDPDVNRQCRDVFGEQDADAWANKAGPLLEAYAVDQYKHTQQHLKDRGITKVATHRGMCWDADNVPVAYEQVAADAAANGRAQSEGPVGTNPLSCWSNSEGVATEFAYMHAMVNTNGDECVTAVLSGETSASQVWSTALTGPGCRDEREVVTLPSNRTVRGTWEHHTSIDAAFDRYDQLAGETP